MLQYAHGQRKTRGNKNVKDSISNYDGNYSIVCSSRAVWSIIRMFTLTLKILSRAIIVFGALYLFAMPDPTDAPEAPKEHYATAAQAHLEIEKLFSESK